MKYADLSDDELLKFISDCESKSDELDLIQKSVKL
jgi:hypothetical protein